MDKVTLRDDWDGSNRRTLWAYIDDVGSLHVDGQDLGPGVAASGDGEYEWFRTFIACYVPRVLRLLDGGPGEDAATVLERWVGRAYELEQRLRESKIPSEFSSYSG